MMLITEEINQEQAQYIENNGEINRQWVNVSQAHSLEVVHAGFNYYIKVIFSPTEFYYIKSFASKDDAIKYVKHL